MGHWKLPLVIGALVITLAACCCSSLGGLLGETEFTAGDFADVPVYPGATQSTESDRVLSTMTQVLALVAQEAEWKHYITTASADDVMDWYEDTLSDYGWVTASLEGANVQAQNTLIYAREDDPNVMLAIFVVPNSEDSSKVDILIGRLRISSE